jgi:hypothetical protein
VDRNLHILEAPLLHQYFPEADFWLVSQDSERINQVAEITSECLVAQKLMARSNQALLVKSLFFLKMVPKVIHPAMGSFQLGCIKRQIRTIEATNIVLAKVLGV